jgi:hypothetical protein
MKITAFWCQRFLVLHYFLNQIPLLIYSSAANHDRNERPRDNSHRTIPGKKYAGILRMRYFVKPDNARARAYQMEIKR